MQAIKIFVRIFSDNIYPYLLTILTVEVTSNYNTVMLSVAPIRAFFWTFVLNRKRIHYKNTYGPYDTVTSHHIEFMAET